ncbi:GH25 family lysozyme [Leifsonia sp. F6_8S_P_1B]|uniref:GH25 family lysozyme n=1 Tax=Leifsonia williamsii TaxID=3035919 RepID=A0ABT8KG08_9MICO|nr:GH25 family lysozyme [Leifsonia williamsii]MDN4616399.1 GH25 family lysozyme [Leifsonia williamsii]
MSILGVDLSSNNPVFDWALAWSQGVRAAYIKLGGDNIPRYVSSSYPVRVDDARRQGMIVGHYWVTGGHDPVSAAEFFVRNLRNPQPGDFFVLDNEHLDDGNMYSDAEAAIWIRTVQAAVGGDKRRVFHYASGSPMKQKYAWTQTIATGAQALVAWYDQTPLEFPRPLGDWPESQIGGHQYTSSANLGNGGRIDANAFKDNALTFTNAPSKPEDDVPNIYEIVAGKTGDATHYLSINRASRYPLTAQAEKDYQYWLKNTLGYTDAQVAVKPVDSLASFGPIVRDAPSGSTPASGTVVDVDALAAALAPLVAKKLSIPTSIALQGRLS